MKAMICTKDGMAILKIKIWLQQGVYVWKVTGRFADGEYFDRVGDVTFLH